MNKRLNRLMENRQYLCTYTGYYGVKYHVFRNGNQYGWITYSGDGFTNQSLDYIRKYLREVKGVLA
jgi:hypothetical protein